MSDKPVPHWYPWLRLAVAVTLMTIGSGGMWIVVVVLPAVQAEFAVARADASMPYSMTMIGFALGGILMGRLTDRFGIVAPVVLGGLSLGAGFVLASQASSLWLFALAQGVLIGLLGSSSTLAPLMTDVSLWFTRNRGMAVAICASGNYLAGALWPPVVQYLVDSVGWRDAYFAIGVFCTLSMLPLSLALRRRPPILSIEPTPGHAHPVSHATGLLPLGFTRGQLQALLCVAGVGCCVAMSMPQVHIVAYCGDLGFGPARGAEMLSLMLAFGIVSRLASGFICDRIGGLRTLLLGSSLQMLALILYIPFDSLGALYVVSALFGLFQGGIIPSYTIIVREHFPPSEAGTRVAVVLTATLLGMALGGWLSGKVFDLTGSYTLAFVHGIAWNLLNLAIVVMLLRRGRQQRPPVLPSAAQTA